jgi:NADH dehydrogenase
MRYRRVTVFGASGFIGRYVVKRLGAKGAVIAAAGSNADRAGFLRPMGDVGQITPLRASILDEAEVAAAVAGADMVVNLVGILAPSGRATFEAVHRDGAGRVARLAKAAGARHLVHVSAIGADKGSPSAYARTKAEGEEAVRAAFPEAVIFRPSIVFGPEDHFFNRFAAMARVSPVLPLIGGGHTRFQPVYVGDVAEAIVKGLDDPALAGRTFELGGPRAYTFKELMELVLAETHRKRGLMPMSWGLARFEARFLELLPDPPLTRDQVELLKRDNVVAEGAAGFAELGIEPTAVEAIIPTYLDRYRKGGWFGAHGMTT